MHRKRLTMMEKADNFEQVFASFRPFTKCSPSPHSCLLSLLAVRNDSDRIATRGSNFIEAYKTTQ